MAEYKESVQTQKTPIVSEQIGSYNNPKQYYHMTPTWTFANADLDMWAFSKEHIGWKIWTEVLPYLRAIETKTWAEILVQNKKTESLSKTEST